MNKRTIEDLPDHVLSGARVLVRADYNVPLSGGHVADDARIRATLPTLRYLLERDARVIVMSHFGRPKGKWDEDFSLRPSADCLAQFLDVPVRLVPDVVGGEARDGVAAMKGGEVLMLENTRFLPGEATNDPKLAEQMAALGTVYVNDAFGAAHRAHASTVGAPEHMKGQGKPAVAGLVMAK
jgi:phosphoglycerate kinase